MGTIIYESKDGQIRLKRFWGGTDRGVYFCLTNGPTQYIEVSQDELIKMFLAVTVNVLEEKLKS